LDSGREKERHVFLISLSVLSLGLGSRLYDTIPIISLHVPGGVRIVFVLGSSPFLCNRCLLVPFLLKTLSSFCIIQIHPSGPSDLEIPWLR
jgi:hypothetical protein